MIKICVSDVDGTLLPAGLDEIPEKTIKALSDLKQSGVKLAIASGRSHYSLEKLFSKVSEGTYFICNDGSVCVKDGKVLYTKPISATDVFRIIREDKYSSCGIMLCCPKCAYVIKGGEEFAGNLRGLHNDDVRIASNIYDIQEPVCKIAVFSKESKVTPVAGLPAMLRVSYNDNGWCEYVSAISDKGLALSDLQMRLYLSKYDTACIGDGVNDLEMMKKAKYPISAGDAASELAAVCTYHTDDVERTLLEIADGTFH